MMSPEQIEGLKEILAAEDTANRVTVEDEDGVFHYYMLNDDGEVVEVS